MFLTDSSFFVSAGYLDILTGSHGEEKGSNKPPVETLVVYLQKGILIIAGVERMQVFHQRSIWDLLCQPTCWPIPCNPGGSDSFRFDVFRCKGTKDFMFECSIE